jgi:hypothetical protein
MQSVTLKAHTGLYRIVSFAMLLLTHGNNRTVGGACGYADPVARGWWVYF